MDVITHVSDLQAFRDEAKILAKATKTVTGEDGVSELEVKLVPDLSYYEETDELVYGVTKVPVFYSMPESVTLIRTNDDSELSYFEHFHRLGECINGEYVFDSPESQETYERVRGDLTATYTDENGNEQTYTKPYMIGVFA